MGRRRPARDPSRGRHVGVLISSPASGSSSRPSTRCWRSHWRPAAPRAATSWSRRSPAQYARRAGRRCSPPASRSAAMARDLVAAEYGGPLRDIIHAFKYERRRSLTRPLARLMAEAARDVLHDAACVVPVPLHPWKRLTRGFNQAADLAAELGPPLVHALWRPRWARAQVGLPAAQRRRNVQGAFAASPWLRRAAACRLDRRPGGGAGGRCAHYRRHVVGVRAGADVDGCRRSATPDACAGTGPRRRKAGGPRPAVPLDCQAHGHGILRVRGDQRAVARGVERRPVVLARLTDVAGAHAAEKLQIPFVLVAADALAGE